MNDITAEMQTAIASFLEGASLPVFCASPAERRSVGSGTLFRISGRPYLITAAHVARAIPEGCLALPTSRAMSAVSTLGPHTRIQAELDEHDVAVIPIEDPEVVERLGDWRWLTPASLAAPRHPHQMFMVAGYPGGHLVNKPPQVVIVTHGLGETETGDHPDHDLVLEFPPEPVDLISGAEVDAPRLQGMSGASVWVVVGVQEGAMWSPESNLKVVAIQTSAKHREFVRAKRWHLMWSLFRAVDVQAADEIRAALESDY